jgi:hypothetical protein
MRGKGTIEQGVLIHERRTVEYPPDVRQHLIALGRIGVHEEALSTVVVENECGSTNQRGTCH